jgi:HK97 family phage portal protein
MAVFAAPRKVVPGEVVPGSSSYAFSDRFEHRALTFLSPPVGAYTEALQAQSEGDPEGALKHSAWWSCADLIASTMAMLTPWAYEGPGYGAGQATRLPVQPQILLQPGGDADIYDFLYMGTIGNCMTGRQFGKVVARDKLQLPLQVELENPSVVRVRKQEDGTYEYRFRNEVVKPPVLWSKQMFRYPGSPLGMSPVQYGLHATRLGLGAERFGNMYFEDGGHPSAILTNENTKMVSQQDAQTLKQRFMAALRGSREPVVLGGGWKYEKIQISPDESMFLDTQKLSDGKVCRYMRVAPEMVGCSSEGSAITYANVEQRALGFLTYTMFRWIKKWEMWLGACLPPGQYVKFDLDSLLRVDFLTLWQGLHMAVGSRIITQDEGREIVDRSPLTPEQKEQIDALVTPLPPPVAPPRQGE